MNAQYKPVTNSHQSILNFWHRLAEDLFEKYACLCGKGKNCIYWEIWFLVQAFLFVFMMLVSVSEAQKGGAKAGMRRGGRNGGRGGSSRRAGSNHAADTGMDSLGGGSGRRACVGLCYLRLIWVGTWLWNFNSILPYLAIISWSSSRVRKNLLTFCRIAS